MVSDDLLTFTSKVDALVDRIDALLDHQQRDRNHVEVTHTQAGPSGLLVAAVTACFLTYLALILFAIWSIFQINNLTAWENVYGRDLAAIKGQIQQREKKP